MFQQQAMDEDVTAANFLQEDAFCGVVEKVRIVPRDITIVIKDAAQGEVLDAGSTTSNNHGNQPKTQPINQPSNEPVTQPVTQPKTQPNTQPNNQPHD